MIADLRPRRASDTIANMKRPLIILRGNSGSGKTTTATLLRERLGRQTMLVSQDVVRREILWVHDTEGNPSIDLLYEMCLYGNRIGRAVILEGILSKKKYDQMISRLIADFDGPVYVFYFDVPFDETVRRHQTKPNAHEFGEDKIRQWWLEKDYLGVDGEIILGPELTQEEIVQQIVRTVQ